MRTNLLATISRRGNHRLSVRAWDSVAREAELAESGTLLVSYFGAAPGLTGLMDETSRGAAFVNGSCLTGAQEVRS